MSINQNHSGGGHNFGGNQNNYFNLPKWLSILFGVCLISLLLFFGKNAYSDFTSIESPDIEGEWERNKAFSTITDILSKEEFHLEELPIHNQYNLVGFFWYDNSKIQKWIGIVSREVASDDCVIPFSIFEFSKKQNGYTLNNYLLDCIELPFCDDIPIFNLLLIGTENYAITIENEFYNGNGDTSISWKVLNFYCQIDRKFEEVLSVTTTYKEESYFDLEMSLIQEWNSTIKVEDNNSKFHDILVVEAGVKPNKAKFSEQYHEMNKMSDADTLINLTEDSIYLSQLKEHEIKRHAYHGHLEIEKFSQKKRYKYNGNRYVENRLIQ